MTSSNRAAQLSIRCCTREVPCKSLSDMPTILRQDGFRFFFFSNEGNEPPHIHVEQAEGYAKYWLDTIELVDSYALNPNQLRKVRNLIKQNRVLFREAWNEYFGES